jgi:two-component system, OmpR family, KDP operon response regulator KdpE
VDDVSDIEPVLLVVEDEAQMRRFLRTSLSTHGYRVVEATTGEEALTLAKGHNPELVLLDLGLPDMDGLEVARKLREWMKAPIIVVSARGQEDDKVRALDEGADDYLTKPFGTGELMARIRVALRHAARAGVATTEPVIVVGDIRLDLDKRAVTVRDAVVHLTPIEYKLLTCLMKNAGRVLTHRQLLKEVWGPSYATQTQYLRVYMTQLRHKLEHDATRPKYFVTEPGVGYRFKTEA